jgi:uncharacterized protein
VPHFLVTYRYTGDDDARLALRPTHRAFLAEQDSLVASGPTDDGGALLLFEADSAADIETLLDDDPYAKSGFVGSRSVVGWDIVLGRWADRP